MFVVLGQPGEDGKARQNIVVFTFNKDYLFRRDKNRRKRIVNGDIKQLVTLHKVRTELWFVEAERTWEGVGERGD